MNKVTAFFEVHLPKVIMGTTTIILGFIAGKMLEWVASSWNNSVDPTPLILSAVFILLFGISLGMLIGWTIRNSQAKKLLGMTLEEAAEKLKAQEEHIQELENKKEPDIDDEWVKTAIGILSNREKAELWTAYDLGDTFDERSYYIRNAMMLHGSKLILKLDLHSYRINPVVAKIISEDEELEQKLHEAWLNSELCVQA